MTGRLVVGIVGVGHRSDLARLQVIAAYAERHRDHLTVVTESLAEGLLAVEVGAARAAVCGSRTWLFDGADPLEFVADEVRREPGSMPRGRPAWSEPGRRPRRLR